MNMNNIILISCLILSMFCQVFAAPLNLTCAKRAVISYYDSGEFENDANIIVRDADQYLDKRIEENSRLANPQKLAIVMDIDDASLSNFEGNKKRDFAGTKEGIEKSYQESAAKAIPPVLTFYNKAKKLGVDVFFITFRPDEFRTYTIRNLQNEGYYGWSGLYMPSQDEVQKPAQEYKTSIRKMLTDQGYTIILSLGDQDSDLEGGYVEHLNKIPNPLYTTSPSTSCPAFAPTA